MSDPLAQFQVQVRAALSGSGATAAQAAAIVDLATHATEQALARFGAVTAALPHPDCVNAQMIGLQLLAMSAEGALLDMRRQATAGGLPMAEVTVSIP